MLTRQNQNINAGKENDSHVPKQKQKKFLGPVMQKRLETLLSHYARPPNNLSGIHLPLTHTLFPLETQQHKIPSPHSHHIPIPPTSTMAPLSHHRALAPSKPLTPPIHLLQFLRSLISSHVSPNTPRTHTQTHSLIHSHPHYNIITKIHPLICHPPTRPSAPPTFSPLSRIIPYFPYQFRTASHN